MYNEVMQFEVPQFIEIEDKVIGPFTWKQFLYLGGGGLFAVVLFLTTSFLIFIILGLPVLILAAALAFYPINNRPFALFLEAFITFYSSSRLYRWQRKDTPVYKYKQDEVTPRQDNFNPPPTQKKNLVSLSRRLELDAMQRNQS